MNMKVIVIWSLAIVIFGVIGLFGCVNQDLLVDENMQNEEYIPKTDTSEKTRVCSRSDENITNSYQFTIDGTTNYIKRISISYLAFNAEIDSYSAATNLNNADINGLNINLSGSSTEFNLSINVDLTKIDLATLSNYANDLSKLNIIIDAITDYDSYKTALNSSEKAYNCD